MFLEYGREVWIIISVFNYLSTTFFLRKIMSKVSLLLHSQELGLARKETPEVIIVIPVL